VSTKESSGLEEVLSRETDASPRRLSEVVYEKLQDDIRQGDLQPGEPISENRLSEKLDISRTPIREALQRLAQEGLVENQPGQAVSVSAPSMQDVMDVIHVRSLLSPEIARQVAANMSDEERTKLEDAVDRMEEAVDADRDSWAEADADFHETLYRACPNQLLGELAIQMRNRIQHLTRSSRTSTERISECTEEHRAVVDAIADEDPDRAAEAMKKHIRNLRESIVQKMAHEL